MSPKLLPNDNHSVGSGSGSDIDNSSSRMDRSVTGSSVGTGTGDETPQHVIADRESKLVAESRILVFAVLLALAGAAGVLTYWYSRGELRNEFETEFNLYADEIRGVSKDNAISTFGILRSLSDTLTSFSNSAGSEWPLITIPDFEHRSHNYLTISGAEMVAFAPLVLPNEKPAWVDFSVNNQGWIEEGLKFGHRSNITVEPIRDRVWKYSEHTSIPLQDDAKRTALPLWQMYPAPEDTSVINYNLRSNDKFERSIYLSETTKKIVLSEVLQKPLKVFDPTQNLDIPKSVVVQPILESFDPQAPVAGFLLVILPWDMFFKKVFVEGALPVICVVSNSCGNVFSYLVDGPKAIFLGNQDLHDTRFNEMEASSKFPNFDGAADSIGDEITSYCEYSVSIYPSKEFEEQYMDSTTPITFTIAVLAVFFITSMVFVLYDTLVQRLKSKVVKSAERSNAIVNSLFPQEVQDRLYKAQEDRKADRKAPKVHLQNFLSDADKLHEENHGNKDDDALNGDFPGQVYKTKPIADLFPDCTIMFADICGFTAWSSVREPSQVFTLLECIYNSFDVIARRSKVFKVETIGDCYVAVCGLPNVRKDHAVAMSRFAHKCLQSMKEMTDKLEVTLGPDTGNLAMRFGLHSGPVTAGVLRGEKSRFQLFGDTVNTTARIEGSGERNKIHCSEETAKLLTADGKGHWLTKRAQIVFAKGKGEMQTYWVLPTHSHGESSMIPGCAPTDLPTRVDFRTDRVVEWTTGIMLSLLKKVVAHRNALLQFGRHSRKSSLFAPPPQRQEGGQTVLDEVQEIIQLPKFEVEVARHEAPLDMVELPPEVEGQLRLLVSSFAALYHDNPFHSFEHASHVTMSVSKLLFRIVAPEVEDETKQYDSLLHDYTYGITSDPLTQFAVAFSALIHDLDHPGVPNAVQVKEQTPLAVHYRNKSVAEQHSVDIGWSILMGDEYNELRACIFSSDDELHHFRQLVVNSVMATDIVDKDLGALRKARWSKAFDIDTTSEHAATADDINRKATIVIEHLIQASDVAHTMQHWEVYQKWNEKFFHECYLGYQNGRLDTDPLENWYKGEIGFFDFYIIPLAKKLKECGVFGVSSDEYLNYATQNRLLWEQRGEAIVNQLRIKYAGGGAAAVDNTAEGGTGNSSREVISAEDNA